MERDPASAAASTAAIRPGAGRPLRLVLYGKGGSGKSTIAANLSAHFALEGRRVLHVGCDPKHDSTRTLAPEHPIPTVIDRFLADPGLADAAQIVTEGRHGIHCVEAGGPQPGTGCGGRGVMVTTDVIRRLGLTAPGRYDVALFDVVGDVVCGGFAGPVQYGLGELVLVVVSGDILSLYAGNNVAKVVVQYADAGVRLGGVVANLRDDETDIGALERFAAALGTRIVGVLPFTPALRRAEQARTPYLELAPGSAYARAVRALAAAAGALEPAALPAPTPLTDDAFEAFVQDMFRREARP